MEIILKDQSRLTLTEAEAENAEFQRGFKMGRMHQTPALTDRFSEVAWIGYWAGLGMHCNRTAEKVRRALKT